MAAADTRSRTLELPHALRAELARIAVAGYPLETCGLLLGTADDDGARVEALRALRNVAAGRERERYEIDPAEHLRVEREAHQLGLEVVGVWHSHPDRPARPSAADGAGAWERWSYVIAAVDSAGRVDLRAWRWGAEAFREERLSP